MKHSLIQFIFFLSLLLLVNLVFAEQLKPNQEREIMAFSNAHNEQLEARVIKILDSKCNICHRKQNPFMVFNERNMKRRAEKINRMVFKEKRMPKGNEIRLSNEEYATLEAWLFTLNIY
mgnify:CR=1 FL=1